MSVAAEQCLAVYKDAEKRVNAGIGTEHDKVVVALWKTVQDLQSEVTKKDHKISLLESGEATFEKMDQANELIASLKKTRYTH